MAARLTDRQKKKIIADYVNTQSVNATAKMNGVSWDTVKRLLEKNGDVEKKLEEKNRENTADILAYMESQKQLVCEIISKGLMALNDEEKMACAQPSQITTALGTLIDKWAIVQNKAGDGKDKVEVIIDV